ncbi:MAG TPA: RNA 2',3'-cyclic phosphodiesterase [Usitatibacter sp.]|nr:RNA 2',3'-cyclic phosphodiesterase [Usitatibacter sp.]
MRLFFALWPDDALREALGRVGLVLAARAQGKPVPAAKLHMTLAFLGEVAAERFAPAADAAARVKGEAFELLLDEVGAFRSARVAWVGSTAGHPALTALQTALAGELRHEGFELESRPFAAHVTLARRIARPLGRESAEPIAWRVRDFVLVASDTGKGTYEVGKAWRLGE